MSETQVTILLDAVAEASAVGAWSGVLVGLICMWHADWGRRALQLSAVAIGLLAAAGCLLQGPDAAARVVELGTWMSLDSSSTGIALSYQFDFYASVVIFAVCIAVVYWTFRDSKRTDPGNLLSETLYRTAVFTAAIQFVLLTAPALRFAFWQLPVFAGLIVANRRAGKGNARRIVVFQMVGDGCVLLAIVGAGADAASDARPALLAFGVTIRLISAVPSLFDGSGPQVDKLLFAMLGLLWFEAASPAAVAVGVGVAVIGGCLLLNRPRRSPARWLQAGSSGVSAFDRHVLGRAIDGLRNVPRHLAETAEPLRYQSGRFYAITLVLATLALLIGIVGWEVLP